MKIAVELVYKNVIDLTEWDEDWLEQFSHIEDEDEKIIAMLEDIGMTIADDEGDYRDSFDLEIRIWNRRKGWLGAYNHEIAWWHKEL